MPAPEKVVKRLRKFGRFLPAIFFLGGGVWDSLTLKRIDNPIDLSILGVYLLLAGVVVVLIGRKVSFRHSEYLPLVVQFCYGGLFSAFRVYYFKSTASLPSFLFMAVIVVLLVGNEFLQRGFQRVLLTFLFWSLACSMYLTFTLPVALHRMGLLVFLPTMGLSLAASALLGFASGLKPTRALVPAGLLHALLVVFYLTNVIPPVPLSKKHMGIFHQVVKIDQDYFCTLVRQKWHFFSQKSERVFLYRPGDTVYCFSSIFAPAKLNTRVFHYWYHYDPGKRRYVLKNKMEYPLTGGREEGYRGYTYKRKVVPGKWRVKIKNEEKKTLGFINFVIRPTDRTELDFIEVRH